jgi:hypothetical protein
MGTVIFLPKHRAHRADRYSHPAYRRHRRYMGSGLVDDYQPKHKALTPNRPDRLDIW